MNDKFLSEFCNWGAHKAACLTIDIDWAPDYMLEHVFGLIKQLSPLPRGNKVIIASGHPLGNLPRLNLKPGQIFKGLAWGGFIAGFSSGNYLVEVYMTDDKSVLLHGVRFEDPIGLANPTIRY